jgi:redox-sensitive bicupin YhaK (pirin superfamily)
MAPMSGPVNTVDAPEFPDCGDASGATIEISDDREARVGEFRVRRALPRRPRRTVGAWCFADHMGPADITEGTDLIGPHPHIGLQTVTWLLDGELLHRDSLGSEQLIAPGQLNLMTAGDGVAHSEESSGKFRGSLEGIQLWIAQPAATRTLEPAFEHHTDLPRLELDNGAATALVGSVATATSPARHDSPLVGAELALRAGRAQLPLDPRWEYAVIVLRGEAAIDGQSLRPGQLGYLGAGRDGLDVEVTTDTQAMLLGGEPFPEPIVMWWNFVARTPEEVSSAYRSWQQRDGRFGDVATAMPRIPAPPPPWLGDPPSTQG